MLTGTSLHLLMELALEELEKLLENLALKQYLELFLREPQYKLKTLILQIITMHCLLEPLFQDSLLE